MPSKQVPKVLAAYVPVLHRGYIEFFRRFPDVESLYIFDTDVLSRLDYARKELRALSPGEAVQAVSALGMFKRVQVGSVAGLQLLDDTATSVVLPNEDISRLVATELLPNAQITFSPVFLRWNRQNVSGIDLTMDDVPTTSRAVDVRLMQAAYAVAGSSPDIWRRVGAVLQFAAASAESGVWSAANQPLTSPHTPWTEGDPRALFGRGDSIDMSTFLHAEAALIARAASSGRCVTGASLYVTTFPCPPCAMLMAASGIAKCYFAEGYAMLDGRRVLDEAGVKLYRVAITPPPLGDDAIPYVKA